MLFPRPIAVPLIFFTLAAAQNSTNCPELPETGVTMGEPVPLHPEHIPAGCSDFEILVGKCSRLGLVRCVGVGVSNKTVFSAWNK